MLEPVGDEGFAQTQQRDVIAQAGAAVRLAAGNGTATDQATVMDGSAANLVSAAGTGFKIEPEAAMALAESCGESIRILESVAHHLITVAKAPSLGNLPGVSDIAKFTAAVGSDGQGASKAIDSLKSTLNQMQTAYQNAAKSYQDIDQQVKDAVSKFQLPSDTQS